MNIEKLVVRHKRKIEVIWSPSRKIVKVNGKKVECPLPLPEECVFEFYRPATSDKGGVYAEA
jgi:hypothetical protein